MSGRKDVLGMYVGQNESAKFWLSILNGLKNRGVEDILIAWVDGLSGFPQAIEAVYPQTEIQQCIIHQIRNTTRFVSYKEIKPLMADLKKVYGKRHVLGYPNTTTLTSYNDARVASVLL